MSDCTPVFLPDEAATLALGASWARVLTAPLTIYLQGDLGAGKTTFVRGLLRGLGYRGTVKSPTYAIVETYDSDGLCLNHFDLYRFSSPEEWEDAGLDDTAAASLNLIEWPDKGRGFAPPADLTLTLSRDRDGRRAAACAHSAAGQQSLHAWIQNLPAAGF
ncbi:tRNA (adenosine(37)-N6)-threonylcarbamoyltransferase complex ATPase subunit type 1 TsaE [Neisseria leonii]|uniref:tRNA threonylcarbamoyladenosine biosynthesis protein TsaE n=1 Tax=Neisseria leonii TaxID=2995413 RepID=A0A9X4E309_9NEIS|nr:tRNA (adenosine(37)-N6)-threonylcarbamoyltransferase complex ATPase subunit type 1 TsaE [Neisseria sp. 51.81]MDD9327810.1 tRNA (adenosine(37)-N6)-threonylcarbamoyltransferase complex ATPase subunit type 1 TsaE [Neisseria sp. 51.81]